MKRSITRKLLIAFGLTFLVVAGLLLGASLSWRHLMQAEPTRSGLDGAVDQTGTPQPTTAVKDRVVVLILGVDEKDGDRGRSDTVLVAAMDPRQNTLGLVSLPRDAWVEIPGHGRDKLNHAYAYGGYELSMQTVARLLDIPIAHYVIVDFQGFEKVIDAVGGIELEVEKRMYYEDPYQDLVIDLQPGLQVLDGRRALQYARFRADAQGDLGRIQRQQKVIRALIAKASAPASALRVPALVTSLFGAVRTDLSLSRSLEFALTAREMVNGAPLQTATLTGTDQMINQVYYMVPDLIRFRAEAHRVLLGEEPPADYMERARADQAALEAELDRILASQPRTEGNGGDGSGGDGSNGSHGSDGSDGSDGAGQPGGETGAEEPPAEQAGEGEDRESGPAQSGQGGARTVSIVDASGKGLLDRYVSALESLGFQVVSAVSGGSLMEETLVADGSGDPNVAVALQTVLPQARWEPRPPGGHPAIQIWLGSDAD